MRIKAFGLKDNYVSMAGLNKKTIENIFENKKQMIE